MKYFAAHSHQIARPEPLKGNGIVLPMHWERKATYRPGRGCVYIKVLVSNRPGVYNQQGKLIR